MFEHLIKLNVKLQEKIKEIDLANPSPENPVVPVSATADYLTDQSIADMPRNLFANHLLQAVQENRPIDLIKLLRSPKCMASHVKDKKNIYDIVIEQKNTQMMKLLWDNQIPCEHDEERYQLCWRALRDTKYKAAIDQWLASWDAKGFNYSVRMDSDYWDYQLKGKAGVDITKQPFINKKGEVKFLLADPQFVADHLKSNQVLVPSSYKTVNVLDVVLAQKIMDQVNHAFYHCKHAQDLTDLFKFGIEVNEIVNASNAIEFVQNYIKLCQSFFGCIRMSLTPSWETKLNEVKKLYQRPLPEGILDDLCRHDSEFIQRFNQSNQAIETNTPLSYRDLMGMPPDLINAALIGIMQLFSDNTQSQDKANEILAQLKEQPPSRLVIMPFYLQKRADGSIKKILDGGSGIKITSPTDQDGYLLITDFHKQMKVCNIVDIKDQIDALIFKAYEKDSPAIIKWLAYQGFGISSSHGYYDQLAQPTKTYQDWRDQGSLLFAFKHAPKCYEFFKKHQLHLDLIKDSKVFVKQLSNQPVNIILKVAEDLNLDLAKLHDAQGNNVLHGFVQPYEMRSGWHSLIKAFPQLVSQKNKEGQTPVEKQLSVCGPEEAKAFKEMISKKELLVLNKKIKQSESTNSAVVSAGKNKMML